MVMADSRTHRRTTRQQRRAYDAFTLNEFASQLDELGIEELANYFAVTICGQFAISGVQVFLRTGPELSLTASKGLDEQHPETQPLSQQIHSELVNNKSARKFDGVKTHPTLSPIARAFTVWQPSLFFPMVHKSSVVGLCVTGKRLDRRPLSEYQVNLLSAMVSHVSLAIGNSHVLEKVRETRRIIENMHEEKKAMDDNREDFIRMACHELNTPLTIINLSLNMLLEEQSGKLTAYQKDLIEQVRQNSGRLAEIHNDLITYAKRKIPAREHEFAEHDFREILNHAIENAVPLFAERPDVTLDVSVADGLPPIAADKKSLGRALTNVLQNAIKYTPESGGKITVNVSMKDDCVVCGVTDNGIGVDPAHVDRVFEPFVELIDTCKRSSSKTGFLGAGLGLGLTIARDIVVKHGGGMWLSSKGKNTGTTVTLKIPATG